MSRVSESDTDAILPVSIGTAVWAIVLLALCVPLDLLVRAVRRRTP